MKEKVVTRRLVFRYSKSTRSGWYNRTFACFRLRITKSEKQVFRIKIFFLFTYQANRSIFDHVRLSDRDTLSLTQKSWWSASQWLLCHSNHIFQASMRLLDQLDHLRLSQQIFRFEEYWWLFESLFQSRYSRKAAQLRYIDFLSCRQKFLGTAMSVNWEFGVGKAIELKSPSDVHEMQCNASTA